MSASFGEDGWRNTLRMTVRPDGHTKEDRSRKHDCEKLVRAFQRTMDTEDKNWGRHDEFVSTFINMVGFTSREVKTAKGLAGLVPPQAL